MCKPKSFLSWDDGRMLIRIMTWDFSIKKAPLLGKSEKLKAANRARYPLKDFYTHLRQ